MNNKLNKLSMLPCALVLFPMGAVAAEQEKQETAQRPNIIFILTDDQGKNDLACEGNPYVKTPNIDAFYKQAVRFTNYHVSTTSAPSRSSIMTGRHTNRLNTYHTINGRSILFEDEVILPQVLAQNGYVNGLFGKWHLGDNYPYRPEDRGFHEVVRLGGGGVGQAPDYWDNDYFDDTYWHNGTPQAYKGYCTDVFFKEALKFIETNKDRPFFCYLPLNAPHGPYNVPKDYYDLYKNEKLPDAVKRFYGMITNIDDNFALLERKLKEWGLQENTILVFTTDNGTSAGSKIYSAGMTGHKGSEYEGGHRVPFYIRWNKGNISGGEDIHTLVAHYDLLPTFVDLLGLDFHPVKPLDGKSLKPLFEGRGDTWENRVLYMDTQREINLIKYKNYSVMDDNWRLINGKELYDMRTDLAQKHNVIDAHPEVVARLAEGYERWWASIQSENPNERYAHILAGTENENPVRISSHDELTGGPAAWHQTNVIKATPASGLWKIAFAERGTYRISLCRFPREKAMPINATFPAAKPNIELQNANPASVKSDFVQAELYVAGFKKQQKIAAGDTEVSFTATISEGKYDMMANLIDSKGVIHPAYYIYVEKVSTAE